MKLTEEQRKMVEDNHNLIYGYCKMKNLNIDDWYGDLAISLCEAVQNYDSSKSNLSTFAYKYFDNKILYKNREKNFNKRKTDLSQNKVYNNDMRLSKDKYYMLDSEYNCNLIMEKMNNRVGKLVIKGMSRIDIAKELNISMRKVNKILNNLYTLIKSEMFD